MLDWHRLAPYPELTFRFFGEVVGQRQGEGEAAVETHRTGREGLADLGTKAAQQARGKGGGQEAAGLPLTLPVPLAGPRHPSGHFPTSSEGRKGVGAALAKEKEQGRGAVTAWRPAGDEGTALRWRMKCDSLMVNRTWLPNFPFPGL